MELLISMRFKIHREIHREILMETHMKIYRELHRETQLEDQQAPHRSMTEAETRRSAEQKSGDQRNRKMEN